MGRVDIRFDEFGHCYVRSPYSPEFIAELKDTFNSPGMRDTFTFKTGDGGAEWVAEMKAWKVYTGWHGCAHWHDILMGMLEKHYPGGGHYGL